jgi:hypothetical protein
MVAGVKMGAGTDSPTMGVVATCGSGWHRAWGQNMVQGVDASVWAVAAEAAWSNELAAARGGMAAALHPGGLPWLRSQGWVLAVKDGILRAKALPAFLPVAMATAP